MKIVNIIGGLGNQMFQYAFALALQAEFPDEVVKINKLCFNGYPLHNGFELDRLIYIGLPFASLTDLIKYAYPWPHYRLWQAGTHILPSRSSMVRDRSFKDSFSYDAVKDKSYFDGYWQSPMYFGKHKKAVLEAFNLPEIYEQRNIEALDFINIGNTAFIHVRRGDYMGHPLFGGICTLDYYKNAIEYVKSSFNFNRFLIFSNDSEWTHKNILPLLSGFPCMAVDWNKGEASFRDMQLMSKCQGGIIANSSFSWWGAWMSGSDSIVAPSKWCNDSNIHKHIVPENWHKIAIK